MSAEPKPAGQPRVEDSLSPTRKFLSDITIEYGPAEELARLFLLCDTAAREAGVELSFAPVEDLMKVNRANSDSWLPLTPIFDHSVGGFNNENGFCLLGRNSRGEVIATQAARLYEWQSTNFGAEARSLRMFYSDPENQKLPGERCEIEAPSADFIKGRCAYSGAVWYRPDFRTQRLSPIMPRVARAYALTKWYTDFTFSFMGEKVIENGLYKRAGYTNVDWEARLIDSPVGPGVFRSAVIWMRTEQLLSDMRDFIRGLESEIDIGREYRTA